MAVVDNFLRVTQSKGRLPPGLTAVICRSTGIAAPDRAGEAIVIDAAAEPAAAELLIFSVETAIGRYPDLEIDDRIARRSRRARNSAKCWECGMRDATRATRSAAWWCVECPPR